MAIKISLDSFLAVIKRSGLLSEEQLNSSLESFRAATGNVTEAKPFAEYLVRQKTLTVWQAEKVLQGKHKGFFLGRYRLLSLLGKGGMSSVFLAEHTVMKRFCALKVLPAKRVHDASYLGRFHREAQAVAALDHPNIVRAYDVDMTADAGVDIHFLAMEFVQGKSLLELVQEKGPLSVVDTVEYMRQSALGLDHAHKAGLIHRDIKPGNLLVTPNRVLKILDLGLARFFDDGDHSLTVQHDEKVLGTADYISPEQAIDSHKVDCRTDLYSLGCTMYFLLTGHPPFNSGSLAQRLVAHQTRPIPPIQNERPEVPVELQAVIEKMTAKKMEDRYQSALAVADALALCQKPSVAKPAPVAVAAVPPKAAAPVATATPATTSPKSPASDVKAPAAKPQSTTSQSSTTRRDPKAAPAVPAAPSAAVPIVAPTTAVAPTTPASNVAPASKSKVAAAPKAEPAKKKTADSGAIAAVAKTASDKTLSLEPHVPLANAGDADLLGSFLAGLSGSDEASPAPADPVSIGEDLFSLDAFETAPTPQPPAIPAVEVAVDPAIPEPVVKLPAAPEPVAVAPVAIDEPELDFGMFDQVFNPSLLDLGALEEEPVAAAIPAPTAAAPLTTTMTEPPAIVLEEVVPVLDTIEPPQVSSLEIEPTLPVAPEEDGLDLSFPNFEMSAPEATSPLDGFADDGFDGLDSLTTASSAPQVSAPAKAISSPTKSAKPAKGGLPAWAKQIKPQWMAAGGGGLVVLGVVIWFLLSRDSPGTSASPTADVPVHHSNPPAANAEVIEVGPQGNFATIHEALTFVRKNFRPLSSFESRTIQVAGGATYPESIQIVNGGKSQFPRFVTIRSVGDSPAILAGSGTDPVIHLHEVEWLTIEGFVIDAKDAETAVHIEGNSPSIHLNSLRVENFKKTGILLEDVTGQMDEEFQIVGLRLQTPVPDAVGIHCRTSSKVSMAYVQFKNMQLIGPLKSGIEFPTSFAKSQLSDSIISACHVGVRFEGGLLDEISLINNTFAKNDRAIVFAKRPSDESHNLKVLHTLFSGNTSADAATDIGDPKELAEKLLAPQDGRRYNRTDRKEGDAKEVDLFTGDGQRGAVTSFASNASDAANFMKPSKPDEVKVATPAEGAKGYIGAVTPE